jgi:outer membrane immunogenic protein
VNYSPNDPLSLLLFTTVPQPFPSGYRIPQSGAVGGVEAGYNWQWSSWLLGVEADFSFAGMSGRASGTSLAGGPPPLTQSTTAEQSTDWFGTVRGRAGWLATPNLLLFGTGGFAYGRVAESANQMFNQVVQGNIPPFSFVCSANTQCFAGSSSAIRTGWAAGGGVEWLLDQHWSAKIEYQFVDLGTETVRVTAVSVCTIVCGVPFGTQPASLNAAFHDRFNVVRLGLNYRY